MEKSIEDRLADIERRLDAIEAGKSTAIKVHVNGSSGDEQIRNLAMTGARQALTDYIFGNHECGTEEYVGSGKIDVAAMERIVQQTMERLFPEMQRRHATQRG